MVLRLVTGLRNDVFFQKSEFRHYKDKPTKFRKIYFGTQYFKKNEKKGNNLEYLTKPASDEICFDLLVFGSLDKLLHGRVSFSNSFTK